MTLEQSPHAPMGAAVPEAPYGGLRPETELMTPPRLSALQPTLLSFSRSLLRRMIRERWGIERRVFELDAKGRGDAVYEIDAGTRKFSFVVFAFEPAKPEERTDRIIGHHWDMMAALLEGEATRERIEHTRRELPKLYSGRAAQGSLVWARSNRSLRLFNHVVDALAEGGQPDVGLLADVCYILRNTGLDANGTFGTRSFLSYGEDHPLRIPYHAQMLSAYMMREFSADLANSMAAAKSPGAATLDPAVRRFLGLGNSSGLGLVLWVNNHPRLVARWLELRERALDHAKAARIAPGHPQVQRLRDLLARCIRFREQDRIGYNAFASSAAIAEDLERIAKLVEEYAASGTIAGQPVDRPWRALCEAAAVRVRREGLEQLHALLVDLDPEYVDRINPGHVTSESLDVIPDMPAADLREILRVQYDWALQTDMEAEGARRYFWYKSIEAEEPRRGIRGGGVDGHDLGLDIPGDVQRLDADLAGHPGGLSVAEFLLREPQHRAAVRRVQGLYELAYHSPHMNSMGEGFAPAHIIRLVNASFYGLDKTRDVANSHNRWIRGVMFHGAPAAAEISAGTSEDWAYPEEPSL
jgi:hypothetical protein